VNRDHKAFIRHYRAPLSLATGQERMENMGSWYGEYDGIFTVREFVVRQDEHALVAPFDMPFREPGHPTEPPALAGIAPISLQTFETLWEQCAQPRLQALTRVRPAPVADTSVRYFRSPFPNEYKVSEATSDIYTEYAAGVARRSFEVFADHTLVAPYDVGIPEVDSDEMLQAAHGGLAPDGALIDARLRPKEIRHDMFETLWEQRALPRLHELAELSSSTRDG
jgi:hypothetical protein